MGVVGRGAFERHLHVVVPEIFPHEGPVDAGEVVGGVGGFDRFDIGWPGPHQFPHVHRTIRSAEVVF